MCGLGMSQEAHPVYSQWQVSQPDLPCRIVVRIKLSSPWDPGRKGEILYWSRIMMHSLPPCQLPLLKWHPSTYRSRLPVSFVSWLHGLHEGCNLTAWTLSCKTAPLNPVEYSRACSQSTCTRLSSVWGLRHLAISLQLCFCECLTVFNVQFGSLTNVGVYICMSSQWKQELLGALCVWMLSM